ncbi:hypothetical protein [Actinokineospora globicatena]|uniref:hypothetical protein n=1 Tax=Actinokineospora globicatena TaxID=103729 RepID=UPI002552DAF2|nr:hypothetical protein [Actinokineospora globicatena]
MTVVVALPGEAEVDPRAYPGSRPGFTLADLERISVMSVPECARTRLRYYIEPMFADSVAFDFVATPECVDQFFAGFGADATKPDFPEFRGRYVSASGVDWHLEPDARLEGFAQVLRGPQWDEQVDVYVDRSGEPHVYVKTITLG